MKKGSESFSHYMPRHILQSLVIFLIRVHLELMQVFILILRLLYNTGFIIMLQEEKQRANEQR